MKRKGKKEGKKGGEGSYRRVSSIGNWVLGKTLKPTRTKDYVLFKVRYPMEVYSLLKFGTRDVNKQALANYKKLMEVVPDSLRENFARVLGVRGRGNKSILLAEKIKDFNGTQSKDLLETGTVGNEAFWKRLAEIEKFFLENHIPFFNLRPENIMVQWTDKQNCRPVFIDFKRMGPKTYPFQPHLFLRSQADKKVRRRFAGIRKEFKA